MRLVKKLICLLCGAISLVFAETVILDHSFEDLEGWFDISTLPCFRGTGNGLFECVSSAGSPTGKAVVIKESLQGKYGDNYPQRGAASLDYIFPTALDHGSGPIVVEWAMKYERREGMQQNNRFMVILLQDMQRKNDLSTVTSYDAGPYSTPNAEYGTPAYHVRITSDPSEGQSYIYLCYGQEIEKTGSGEYIAGFISPYSAVEGNGKWSDPNKLKWLGRASSDIASKFVHYKWVIGTEWQYIEQDGEIVKRQNTSGEDPNLGSGKCFVGPENALPSSLKQYYPDYEHFTRIEGVRLYMRNANEESGTWVSHIRISQLGDTHNGVLRVPRKQSQLSNSSRGPASFNLLGRNLQNNTYGTQIRYNGKTQRIFLQQE